MNYVYKKTKKSEQITRICSVDYTNFWLIDVIFVGHKGGKMFELVSEYKPTGDQPQAIEYLSKGIMEGKKFQTLLGVTGSGKTFTMANIIQKVQKPTLVLAHNKTLARTIVQ